jgi:GT2 family glycosyltransferase
MDVSIIIVNYNTLDTTRQCVESVFRHTSEIDFEVILVDNASVDGSKNHFENDSRLIFIESGENLGFGKANNLGFTKAKGKYIFLLNSDTILFNNAVKELFCAHERMPEKVACLGAVLRAADGITENNSYGVFPSLSNTVYNLLAMYLHCGIKRKTLVNHDASEFRVDYIIGADLFIRRSVIEQLGLFDPDFFMFFEESEMQLRYSRSGYEARIIRAPSIIHLECASIGSSKEMPLVRHRLMYFRSMFLYMRKRYNWVGYSFFRLIVLLYLPIFYKANFKEYKKIMKLFFLTI